MYELLTKTKFINAMVREHVGIDEARRTLGKDTRQEYLRLEVLPGQKKETSRLVIRGNRLGTHWMIWDEEFPNTVEGMQKLHKAAVDVAFHAAVNASAKLGNPVRIGMPPVSYFRA